MQQVNLLVDELRPKKEVLTFRQLLLMWGCFGGLLALKEAENDGYVDVTVRAGYRSNDGWSVIAYVENLTDETYFDGAAEGAGILPAHLFGTSRPRTMGMKLAWEF